jgi:hypothetical protein
MMEHSNIAGWTYAVRIHVGNVWTWPKFYFWHFLKWLSVWRRTYASSKESLPSLFQTKEPVWQKRLPFNVCKHNAHLHHLQTLANSNVDANKINAQTIFVYAQTHVNKQLWHLCPMCVCVCVCMQASLPAMVCVAASISDCSPARSSPTASRSVSLSEYVCVYVCVCVRVVCACVCLIVQRVCVCICSALLLYGKCRRRFLHTNGPDQQ